MENFLRSRVRERLAALGISAFEASRRAGAERTFLAELLSGKKDSIRPKRLAQVAGVLDCDPEYLIGAQGAPRRGGAVAGSLSVAGVCEAGVWREAQEISPGAGLPPDPRFAAGRQAAYLIRGHHADGIGLQDGDLVIGVEGEPVRDGDRVVTRRTRETGEQELAARMIEGGEVRARAGVSLPVKVLVAEVEILARIISAHRAFK